MIRAGTGYDLHRLEAGRPLILGGVRVPFDKGLIGHSDADALTHAIIDALLGAAALGNIGQHFPDTHHAWKDADSLDLLQQVVALLRTNNFEIVNVDATIVAEAPKLNPFLDPMRAKLADRMDLPLNRVSVKAKTNEGVGPEGRGEAISVQAIALIQTKA